MKCVHAIERCCQDLRRYLEEALRTARGGVLSVKLGRVLAVSRAYSLRFCYARCLSRLLRGYRFSSGVYVLARQQAEELLRNLDALCAEKRREKRRKKPKHDREKMLDVSFHIPRTLLQALDEYARRMNLTRSDVIRMAIKQMLDKMRAAEKEETEYVAVV